MFEYWCGGRNENVNDSRRKKGILFFISYRIEGYRFGYPISCRTRVISSRITGSSIVAGTV